MRARTSLWASMVIAASIGLAGCGGSSDNGNGDDGAQGQTPEEQVAAAQADAAAAKAAEDEAKAELAAAQQAAAQKEAREYLSAIVHGGHLIDRKETLTKDFVSGGTRRTSAVDGDEIPALKPNEDDKKMYSGSLYRRAFTARVYTTAKDTAADENKAFAANLPGVDNPTTPGVTDIGRFISGEFRFSSDAADSNTDDSSDGVTYSGISGDGFPTSAGVKTFKANERVFDGTLDGTGGTYACTGNTCEVELVDGDVMFVMGNWIFTPTDASAGIAIKDSAYLSYGWWIREDRGGAVDRVGPVFFSDGGSSTAQWEQVQRRDLDNSASNLDGSATYKKANGAAGQYAMYDPAGHSEVGHFTADVALTATFGDANSYRTNYSVSPNRNDPNRHYITGTIDNFTTMSGGTETETGDDWEVALGKGGLPDVAVVASPTSAEEAHSNFTGSTTWSIGDDKSLTVGDYTAHLYTTEAGRSAAALALDKSPDEIGGTFDAEHGRHRMLGAFAATLRTDDDPAPAAAAQ